VGCFRGDVLLDLVSRIVRGTGKSSLAGFVAAGFANLSPNIFLTASTPHVNSAPSYYGVAFEAYALRSVNQGHCAKSACIS
jgi:tRNA(Met) C34 N-acetyltransferase TmcA